jgi:hypothetical protein
LSEPHAYLLAHDLPAIYSVNAGVAMVERGFMSSVPKLRVDNVSMSFETPSGVFHALAPVSLAIPSGRFVCLIGPLGLRQEHDLRSQIVNGGERSCNMIVGASSGMVSPSPAQRAC